MKLFTGSRKGQSAIEYLMTYGWMLLVVAIVGGAVMMTVQDTQEECEATMSGLDSMDREFGVADFSTTSDGLNIQVENNAQETVDSIDVNVSLGEEYEEDLDIGSLGMGDTAEASFDDFSLDEDSCETVDVTIDYERDGLESELTGDIQDQIAHSG